VKATPNPLLQRLKALRLPDRAVEREARLPQGFLAKARAGRGLGRKATSSWDKLERFLRGRESGVILPPDFKSPPPPPPAPVVPPELLAAIKAARTPRKLAKLARLVMHSAAEGRIERATAAVLVDAVKVTRALALDTRAEEARRELADRLLVLTADEVELVEGHRRRLAEQAASRTPVTATGATV
jgi:hypothetical protein